MYPNPQETADLVTFTEEKILNGKLHFVCRSFFRVYKEGGSSNLTTF